MDQFQMILIGPLKAVSQELKIKVVVDHVGLLVQLELHNLLLKLKVNQLIYQNNNLLIAQDHKEIKVAMVDGHQKLWIICKKMVLLHKINIHIQLKMELVKNKVEV